MIQHSKGLADNGALNETIMDEEPMKKWREDNFDVFPRTLCRTTSTKSSMCEAYPQGPAGTGCNASRVR